MNAIEVKTEKPSPWPWILTGMLAFQASLCMVGVAFAVQDRSFAVESDYHRKAIDWDHIVARQRNSQLLGWHCRIRLDSTLKHPNELILTLSDDHSRPIDGAVVTLQYFHHARASEVYEATLIPEGEGNYNLAVPLKREGIWEFRILATRDGNIFSEQILQNLTLYKILGAPQ